MRDYRAYVVGPDGRISTFEAFRAVDDESAIERAKGFVNGHDVEVWQLDRKIAVLKSSDH